MQASINMDIIACPLCNRDITTGQVQHEDRLFYCYGCNFEFSRNQQTLEIIEEIDIPNGVDTIRLRILNNQLEIRISWFRCFDFKSFIWNHNEKGLLGALALLFNKTTIKATRKQIIIEHKPFDYLPYVRYQRHYIRQFFVKEIESNFLSTFTMTTYGLFAIVSTGEEKLLLWNLKKPTLLFLEQEIERVMGIKNESIS